MTPEVRAVMSRLLITNGVQEGRAYRLRPGVNRIGRSLDNHFQIPDGSVSSNHCELIFSEGRFFVRDLRSTNGTSIDGEPVSEAAMQLGQVLQVGTVELRLEETPKTEEGPSVTIPELPKDRPPVALMLEDGTPACLNHSEAPAAYRCTKCQQTLCSSCVRIIRRLKGEVMIFCPLCSGPCEMLATSAPAPALSWAPKSLLKRLSRTLKVPFRGRS
jgi:pSer/pThr/pTyr-binding forkhead associated (FHA) protein